MNNPITRNDIDHALLTPSPWDLGNHVLYSLCRAHPKHDRADAIIAKVWLIGRSYAAAIERRKNVKGSSDDFYQKTVVRAMKGSSVDKWLSSLPKRMADPWRELGQVIVVHKRLMDLFTKITDLEKRSLASKYLHFHRPDLFFIYDSRAKGAIGKVTPSIRKIASIQVPQADQEYLTFVRRCQWFRDHVAQRFNAQLTPRQLDKMLLRITERMKRPRSGRFTVPATARS